MHKDEKAGICSVTTNGSPRPMVAAAICWWGTTPLVRIGAGLESIQRSASRSLKRAFCPRLEACAVAEIGLCSQRRLASALKKQERRAKYQITIYSFLFYVFFALLSLPACDATTYECSRKQTYWPRPIPCPLEQTFAGRIPEQSRAPPYAVFCTTTICSNSS